MTSSLRLPHRVLLAFVSAGLALALSSGTQAQPTVEAAASAPPMRADNARALERCEASVVETLRKNRGPDAQDVQFVPAQRVVAAAEDGEISVKGAGRYRGRGAGNSFSFSCSFSTKTGLTSGVVLREAGGGPGGRAEAAWNPDLSRISPEACESAVAQLLKRKHPRVAQIAMEPDTRRLQPGADGHVVLIGQGAVQRAPGMNAVPFSYSCEVDPRNGRVLEVNSSV
ncbi:MAG: hypothetical protein JNN03_13175 [Rubrivivax sp.]|nr:hypothetical protein [Rubrivivax sp.]